jgi:hypothetical protein
MKPIKEMTYDEIEAHFKANDARLAADMPDEKACLLRMHDVVTRLTSLGWKDIVHCPKDGTVFHAILAGSCGIFPCHYDGKWPDGTWWCYDGGDIYPSRPILFKLIEKQVKS